MKWIFCTLLTVACSSSTERAETKTLVPIHAIEFDTEHRVVAFTRIIGPQTIVDIKTGTERWYGDLFMREGEVWRVPEHREPEATATALHRIWASEAYEWTSPADMKGIWQVARSIRAKHCNRDKAPRITECRNGEETVLSAMRRLSKRVTGMMPAHNNRTQWLRNLTLTCEKPENWPKDRSWDFMRPLCERSAHLARQVVSGQHFMALTRKAIPIAWGGRCEVPGGACDDKIACQRGLARIPSNTRNAFWCRPGSRGCLPTRDPLCDNFIDL